MKDDDEIIVTATAIGISDEKIQAMAAKLNANGLGPGARVFDVATGEWMTAAEWRAKFDDADD